MEYIQSKDGHRIAYKRTGKGPDLVIVGGSLADHQMYLPLAAELSENLTIFNYDRRNRGKSDHAPEHSIETELGDLAAIIAQSKEAPILYGHSAGAALAIRAAAKGFGISKLIVSDLPFSPLNDESAAEIKKFEAEGRKIRELLKLGDKEGAVKFFLKDFGMSEDELHEFVNSDEGRQAVAIVPTLTVDYDILGDGLTPRELLRRIQIPTLILASGYGLPAARDAVQYLSNAKLEVLENPVYATPADEISKRILSFIAKQP